jgi:hypothetical protein
LAFIDSHSLSDGHCIVLANANGRSRGEQAIVHCEIRAPVKAFCRVSSSKGTASTSEAGRVRPAAVRAIPFVVQHLANGEIAALHHASMNADGDGRRPDGRL